MDITVYLPNDIGTRAKEADLKFSRLLRDAVENELAQQDARAATLADGVGEHELPLINANGDEYVGVLTGKLLGGGTTESGLDVYLTDDGRVMVYDEGRAEVNEIPDPGDEDAGVSSLRLTDEELFAIMGDLGIKPRVRL